MPFGGVYPNQYIDAKVLANSEYATASWDLKFTADSNLEIDRITVDSKKWTLKFSKESKQVLAANAILAKEEDGAAQVKQGLEQLASIRLHIKSGLKVGVAVSLQATVQFLESAKEKNVVVKGTAVLFVDRNHRKPTFPKVGKMYVIGDDDVGIFSGFPTSARQYQHQSIYVNLARLNAKKISAKLVTYLVRSDGKWAVVAKDKVQCSSSNARAMQISSTCDDVFLDGSENQGSDAVQFNVGMKASNLTQFKAAVATQVWWPKLPVAISVSANTLAPISGWFRYNKEKKACEQRFQRTRFAANVKFTRDGKKFVDARVTSIVNPALKSSNAGVAIVGDGVIIGTGKGAANIFLQNGKAGAPANIDGGKVKITIDYDEKGTDGFVKVAGLVATVVTKLSVATKLSSPFVGGKDPSEIVVENKLVREDALAGVAAFASFDDGSQMLVSKGDGLVLAVEEEHQTIVRVPNENEKLIYQPDSIVAVGTGSGPFVKASWVVRKKCNASDLLVLAHGNGKVVAAVKPPDLIRVTVVVPNTCSKTIECSTEKCSSSSTCRHIMAPEGDPLTLIRQKYATYATIKVQAVFLDADKGKILKEMTQDLRTHFNMTTQSAKFAVCAKASKTCVSTKATVKDGLVRLTAGKGVQAGDATFKIFFSHAKLVVPVTVSIVKTEKIETSLHPFPTYSASNKFSVKTLHRYRNDKSTAIVYQQAECRLYATLSNKGVLDITGEAEVGFKSLKMSADEEDDAVVAISNRVIEVKMKFDDLQKGDQAVRIQGTFGSFAAVISPLAVTNKVVEIVSFFGIRLAGDNLLPRGLMGLADKTQRQIIMGAKFSDGTQHPGLITSSSVLLPGAVSFKSLAAGKVAVDAKGMATLKANSMARTTVVLTVVDTPSITDRSLLLSADLLPDVGDVDLGEMRTTAPISAKKVNKAFDVQVRVNTGGAILGSFEIEIRYDPKVLVASKSVPTGSNWPGGIFESVIDPPGVLKLGGAPNTENVRPVKGSNEHLATIKFTAITKGVAKLQGVVVTMAKNDLKGTTIGAKTPRAMVAGDITIQVDASRRSRSRDRRGTAVIGAWQSSVLDAVDTLSAVARPATNMWPSLSYSSRRRQRRGESCDSPPCKECSSDRETGDCNGDCVFDIRDVSFLQLYQIEAGFNFKRSVGAEMKKNMLDAQLTAMDADLDGEITIGDARYLARVNFNLLRFISSVDVRPVQHKQSYGVVSINVSTFQKGDVIDPDDKTALFIDFAHTDKSTQKQFDDTTFTVGGAGRKTKGPSLFGMMVQMKLLGPLYEGGNLLGLPRRCYLSPRDDDLCNSDQKKKEPDKKRFIYSADDKACEERASRGCGPNEYDSLKACEHQCIATWMHSVSMKTTLKQSDIGLSFVMVTFDSTGKTGSGRDIFLAQQGKKYGSKLSVALSVNEPNSGGKAVSVPVLATRGYSPLIYLNNSASSNDTKNEHAPAFTGELHVNISEELSVPRVVTQLKVVDKDNDNKGVLVYEIAHKDAKKDKEGLWVLKPFTLDQKGDVRLTEKQDFDASGAKTVFEFDVKVSDKGPPFSRSTTATVRVNIIDVNDNAPTFEKTSYAATANFDLKVNTPLIRLFASDKDSNTAKGGNNAKLQFAIVAGNKEGYFAANKDTGMILLKKQLPRRKSTLVQLLAQVVDAGKPALHTNATLTFAFTNEDYVITLKTKPLYDEFVRNVDTKTGENNCIKELERILEHTIYVVEVGKHAGSDYTELSFYMVNKDGNFLSSLQILQLLARSVGSVTKFEKCELETSFEPIDDDENLAFIEHFLDSKCSRYAGVQGGVPGKPGACIDDVVAQRSGRLVCKAEGLPKGQVDVRIYDNNGCNVPTLLPQIQVDDSSKGINNGECVALAKLHKDDPTYYIRPICKKIVVHPKASAQTTGKLVTTTKTTKKGDTTTKASKTTAKAGATTTARKTTTKSSPSPTRKVRLLPIRTVMLSPKLSPRNPKPPRPKPPRLASAPLRSSP